MTPRSIREARRPRALLAAAAVALLALAGCTPLQELPAVPDRETITEIPLDGREIIDGGNLVMALSAEPDRLDPTMSSSLYTRYVMQTMCEKLYDIDADGEIVPMLAAELPVISEDGLSVDIPLREGILFSDGTSFDAEAVRTTLDRHLHHEGSSRVSELGPITDIEALDESTVRVSFASPFAPFTAALADRAGMIMSPTQLEKLGDDFGDHPVCVGAFAFEERVPQTSISVVKDENYYDAENVHLDRIEYRIMTDANIRAANIRSEDVHVADTISPQDVDALHAEGIDTLQGESLGYQALTVNLDQHPDGSEDPIDTPLAQDPRVRQALSMAIDREALVNTVFNGWYLPACSAIPLSSPFATEESSACPEHDPDGARALLEEAGAPVPYPIEMKVTNAQDSLRYAQALQAQLAESGFALTIVPTEYTSMLDAQDRGDFETVQMGWSGRVDPHGSIYNFLYTDGSNNYGGISDEELDGHLDAAATTTDLDQRGREYGQVVGRAQETNSIIYLYRTRNLTALTDDVAGIGLYPDGVVRLSHAAFVEEEER